MFDSNLPFLTKLSAVQMHQVYLRQMFTQRGFLREECVSTHCSEIGCVWADTVEVTQNYFFCPSELWNQALMPWEC